jgi:hypothetical protein
VQLQGCRVAQLAGAAGMAWPWPTGFKGDEAGAARRPLDTTGAVVRSLAGSFGKVCSFALVAYGAAGGGVQCAALLGGGTGGGGGGGGGEVWGVTRVSQE